MHTDRLFQRRTEDFRCGQCGLFVEGDGYTNHCPACLFSRHVDVHPGDRAAACGGLMKPIALEPDGEAYRLTHRCLSCGEAKRNRTDERDDREALLGLARRLADGG